MGIDLLIEGRARDIGGFEVRRVLPSVQRRLVGPFIFFDHMGPAILPAGDGMDVRPHPHIALATVTYLFDGEILHRDSVGSVQTIKPGDVNWMVAGRGIVHSERTSPEFRAKEKKVHGIQSWVALPIEHEETEPSFSHHPKATLPALNRDGVHLDVIAGTAFGLTSPVPVLSPTLYVHATMEAGARLTLDDEHEERAVYVVSGALDSINGGTMAVLEPGGVTLTANEPTVLMVVGGAKLEGARHMFWNFVSSSKDRIERAKDDWQNGRFPKVIGDETEFIPLPTYS